MTQIIYAVETTLRGQLKGGTTYDGHAGLVASDGKIYVEVGKAQYDKIRSALDAADVQHDPRLVDDLNEKATYCLLTPR